MKKSILTNFVNNPEVFYGYDIIKLEDIAYSALITFLPGSKELWVKNDEGEQVCLVASGSKILTYLPIGGFWMLCMSYNKKNEIAGWYFDISRKNFVDEDGTPCMYDLYLDLTVWPSGRLTMHDADELKEALDKRIITDKDYFHAYAVYADIRDSKWSDVEYLKKFSGDLLAYFM